MITEFINNPSWTRFLLQILPWILLFIWTLYSIKALFFRKEDDRFTGYYIIQHIPSAFVILGVLGTFAGVTYGLLDFNLNPEQISQSISGLLSGLKNAFFTSLYGMFLSFFTGFVVRYQYSKGVIEDPEVNEQKQEIIKLRLALDEFGDNLAEYNKEAIIGSLKDVIEDFNDTFTTLIGELVTENFIELTQSVDQLVEWQKEYREDVSSLLDSNKELNKRSEELLSSFQQVDRTIGSIADSALELKVALDALRDSIDDESSLSGLISQLEKTTENLVEVTEDADLFKNEIEKITKHLVDTQQEVQGWLNKEAGVRDTANTLNQTLKELRKFDITQIEKLDESFTNRLEHTFQNLDSLMKSYIQYLEEQNGRAA